MGDCFESEYELGLGLHRTAIDNADKPAIKDGNRIFTFKELDSASNVICNFLLNNKTAVENKFIGLYFDNNAEKLFSVQGTIKAGMTYVPFDVRNVLKRNLSILNNVGTRIILTDESDYQSACVLAEKAGIDEKDVIVINDELLSKGNDQYTYCKRTDDDLPYIIYTSGSTGTPKGVMTCDGGLINFCRNIINHDWITGNDTVGILQNFAFDFSILDMFPAMLSGAEMVIIPEDVHQDIYKLNEFINENNITAEGMPTALYNLFLPLENYSLKKLFVGGEKMIQFCKKNYDIYNIYGPTETSVFVTINKIENNSDNISIGKPLDNIEIFIVKDNGKIAGCNEEGEICIQGDCLSKGYINNEEETMKRFVTSVVSPEKIMYRTGDIGYLDENGFCYCLGRKDFQVKLNGFRIEPDEINTYIGKIDGISDSIVILNNVAEHPYLVCFYVSKTENFKEIELKNKLSEYLPQYMIPSRFIGIESLPLNHNRKVDRKALIDIAEKNRLYSKKTTVSDNVEKKVRELWSELTNIDENFDGDDSFNTIGGNSILGMIMIGKIRNEFGIDITPAELFNSYTLNKFVALLKSKKLNIVKKNSYMRDEEHRFDPFPLNEIQMAYFVGRDESAGLGNVPTHIYFELTCNDFEYSRFVNSLEKVVSIHDSLRLRVNDDGIQNVVPYKAGELDIKCVDISEMSDEEQEKYNQKIRKSLYSYRIDCKSQPMMKTVVVKTGTQSAEIMIYIDGMIADGWSQQIIVNDLDKYYNSPDLEITETHNLFRDYNKYIEDMKKTDNYKKSKEYWVEHVKNLPGIPMIPLKCKNENVETVTSISLNRTIDRNIWEKFTEVCSNKGVTSYAALLTIFGHVLSKVTKNKKFLLNVPVLRRFFNDMDFDDIVGTCSSFALLDVGKVNEKSFSKEIKNTYKKSIDVVENCLFSGIEIIREMEKEKNIQFFSVPIVFTDNIDSIEADIKHFNQHGVETRTSQMWLDVFITKELGKNTVMWNFVSELLDEKLMEDMLDDFLSEINMVADKYNFNIGGNTVDYDNKFDEYTSKIIGGYISEYIDDCCVVTDEKTEKIKLYYSTDDFVEPDTLHTKLAENIPEYMLPDEYIEVLEIVRDENGKINYDNF